MVFKSHVDQVSREAEKMQGLESAAQKVLQASREDINKMVWKHGYFYKLFNGGWAVLDILC